MSMPEVILHPLAILTITQSATYTTVNFSSTAPRRSVGILMGLKKGDSIVIRCALEFPESELLEKMQNGLKLFKEGNKDYEIVGWFAAMANCEPQMADIDFHQKVCADQNGVFLLLNTTKCYDPKTDKIPVTLCVVRNNLFVPCKYSIASVDVERIGVNDMINQGTSTEADAKAKEGVTHAVQTMQKKLEILIKYLQQVKEKKIEPDGKILAKIAGICSCIPVSDNSVFQKEFDQENNDAKLIVLVMQLIRSVAVISNNTATYSELRRQYEEKARKEEEKRKTKDRTKAEQEMAKGGMGGFGMGGFGMGGFGMGAFGGHDNIGEFDDSED